METLKSFSSAREPAKRRRFFNLYWQLRKTLVNRERKGNKRICIILNPDAGQDRPILKIFNRVFHQAGYEWEIKVMQTFGDGQRLTRKAISEGVDLIAVYGGDGSIMDAASGMVGSTTPLGIIPGGTGNALSLELGIPRDLASACELLVDPSHSIRVIDAGKVRKQYFFQRVGVGLEETIVSLANRGLKDRIGVLAYALATFQALNEARPSHYSLIMDGQPIEDEGLACMIANAGTLGIPGLNLSPKVDINDGRLDVFIIRKMDLAGIFSMAANLANLSDFAGGLLHWQVKKISITADPIQGVEADGDLAGQSPVEIEIVPNALQVISSPKSI